MTYTSSLTGNTYDVVYSDKGYIHYDIFLNGKWVQFGLTPDDISGAIASYEGISDGWYCLPRD